MSGVRIVLAFIGVAWLLAGTGSGLNALEAASAGERFAEEERARTAAEFDRELENERASLDALKAKHDARIEKATGVLADWEAKVAETPDNERALKRRDEAKALVTEEQQKRDDAVAAAQQGLEALQKEKLSAMARVVPMGSSVTTWQKVGPILGAVLGLVLILGAIALGFMGASKSWAPPRTTTDPSAMPGA